MQAHSALLHEFDLTAAPCVRAFERRYMRSIGVWLAVRVETPNEHPAACPDPVQNVSLLARGSVYRGDSADRRVAVGMKCAFKPRRVRPKHPQATYAARNGVALFAPLEFQALWVQDAEWEREGTVVCGLVLSTAPALLA